MPRHKPAFFHQVGEFCKALLELSCAFSLKQSDEWHQQRWLHQNSYFWLEGFDYHKSQHCGPWLLQSLQIPSNCQIQWQKILGQDPSTCLFHILKGTIILCYIYVGRISSPEWAPKVQDNDLVVIGSEYPGTKLHHTTLTYTLKILNPWSDLPTKQKKGINRTVRGKTLKWLLWKLTLKHKQSS